MSDDPFDFLLPTPKPKPALNLEYLLGIARTPIAATPTPAPPAPLPPQKSPIERLEDTMAWVRKLQKKNVQIERGVMSQWVLRVRSIFTDIFSASSPMVKQIELWRVALMSGNTSRFRDMVDDIEERLETLLDMMEGDGLTEVEHFLPRTFVSFSSSDIGRFRLMQAWAKSEHIPFNFYNCQLKEAINSDDPDYIKRRCRRRIKLASKFILLIGNDIHSKERFVKPEVEAAMEKKCAIIGVNLDQSWRVNSKLTPRFMRNIGALFIPYSPRIIQRALATYEPKPDEDYTFREAVYHEDGYRLVEDKALFQKR